MFLDVIFLLKAVKINSIIYFYNYNMETAISCKYLKNCYYLKVKN